ncbi:MAG: DUF664 domain-containing protein [Fimbriimonadaceae bacterium]|nr:DUF664 domain-containing protein [Fimbriimonadaceae bacterium]
MADFLATWALVRGRFDRELEGLTPAQLHFRLHPGALTLAEMAVHVAGVEVSFVTQLLRTPLSPELARLKAAATDGSVNDRPFPFAKEELTAEFITDALRTGAEMARSILEHPRDEIRAREIVSALGPVIDGTGAMARLAYHPGYHQGQAYLIKTSPEFPRAE